MVWLPCVNLSERTVLPFRSKTLKLASLATCKFTEFCIAFRLLVNAIWGKEIGVEASELELELGISSAELELAGGGGGGVVPSVAARIFTNTKLLAPVKVNFICVSEPLAVTFIGI